MQRRPVSFGPGRGHRRVTVRAMVGANRGHGGQFRGIGDSLGADPSKLPHLGLSERGTGPYGGTVDRPGGSLPTIPRSSIQRRLTLRSLGSYSHAHRQVENLPGIEQCPIEAVDHRSTMIVGNGQVESVSCP